MTASPGAAATLELYGTIEAMGVIVSLDPADDPDRDATAVVEYRERGTPTFRPAFPPDRVVLTRLVGSLFWLAPGTFYDVRLTLSDPDAGPLEGLVLTGTGTTRAEVSIPVALASHHVSPTGNGATCSPSLPCALGQALSVVRAGDEVVLLPGIYHVGGLSLPASGSPGQPIVIRAESPGTAILDGADPGTFSWSSQGGGVFRTTINVAAPQVVADDVRLYPYQSLGDLSSLRWGVAGFFSAGTDLYVRLAGDADPSAARMEVARENVAFTVGRDFIYFVDLTFRNYGQGNWSKGIYFDGGSDNLVQGCTFRHDGVGVGFKRSAARNLVQDSTFADSSHLWSWDAHKASGLLESIATSFFAPADGRGNVIRRNLVSGGFDGIGTAPDGAGGSPTNETDVYDNLVFNLGDDGLSTDGTASNVRIWGNTFHDVLVGISLAPNVVGPTYAIRNVIHRTDTGNNQWPGTSFKFNSGGAGSGPMYVLHNTVDAVTAGQDALRILSPGSWSNIVLRNNILSATNHVFRNGNATEPVDFDHDCMWTSGAEFASWDGPGRVADLAGFQSSVGLERNGRFGLPDFVQPGQGDYRLLPTSVCVDGGVVLPGINDSYDGAAPDMGAFELAGSCVPVFPSGAVGNVLMAVRGAAGGVDLSWSGSTVTPPNHAVMKTASALRLAETRSGIGSETLVTVTSTAMASDQEPLSRFYKVVPADSCDQPFLP